MRAYFGLADKILVYSTRAARELATLGIPRGTISVCQNGIEVDERLRKDPTIRAAAADLRRAEGLEDAMIFLYVGRLTSGKALDLMIAAFGDLGRDHRSVLWLVGDGPALVGLEEQAARRQLTDVKFWGRIIEDVDKYFAAADCFVLPGLGGLALNQAMVARVPCICSTADGTEDDLVTDGVTGLRFVSGDAASLCCAMRRAMELRRDGGLQDMGDAARARVLATSTVDRMVATFSAVVR